jgi:hypothetical protein
MGKTARHTIPSDPIAETPAHSLSGAQLNEILSLLRGSDTVELKVTVPAVRRRSMIVRLGMDPMRAELRQVAYFDTPDLRLNQQGLVVRARRVQRKAGDTVVKVRPVVPSELPDEVRRCLASAWRSTRCRAVSCVQVD